MFFFYYGARYYDPRTSVWQSPDPIIGEYMSGQTNGGVFNPHNLKLYSYTYNNPINLADPDGFSPVDYNQRIKDWRGAERAERMRVRKLGHIPIPGKVYANSSNDFMYIKGREYDSISVDQDGIYHLTEVKYVSSFKRNKTEFSLFAMAKEVSELRKNEKKIPAWLAQKFNTARQWGFDEDAGTITLTKNGKVFEVLEPGEYKIHWVMVNKKGQGLMGTVGNKKDKGDFQKIGNALRYIDPKSKTIKPKGD